MSTRPGRRSCGPAALLLLSIISAAAATAEEDVKRVLKQAVAAACAHPAPGLPEMVAGIPGSTAAADEPIIAGGVAMGWRRVLRLSGGAEIEIELLAPGGVQRRVRVEYRAPVSGHGMRPAIAWMAGPGCVAGAGRRLVYDDSGRALAIEHLGPDLNRTGNTEPLNPPVPAGTDPGGIPVALVDAGVNYLLPEISRRLARDDDGRILGFDFWDMDQRPFDAHPARSPFYPQRHGTRTASLLLREAPSLRLVPYRYPRPDMSRMDDLIRHASEAGVRLVNMSLGSEDPQIWTVFAAAAKRHSEILFIVSAGNNGRDIDTRPVYPAALDLDNIISVTSAEHNGSLAPGSNWGPASVDLLVPAERLQVTGFNGDRMRVSGSSYAAVRVTALAARLLSLRPALSTAQLKTEVLSRVLPADVLPQQWVDAGLIPRPDRAERLPLFTDTRPPHEISRARFNVDVLYTAAGAMPHGPVLSPTVAYFESTGPGMEEILRYGRQAAEIFSACDIVIGGIEVRILDGPPVYHYFHEAIAKSLLAHLSPPRPAIFFVRDTLQADAYDAEAIGAANSATRPTLRHTAWITTGIREPGMALAHELAHLLLDDGRHSLKPGNLMRAETAPGNTALDRDQCAAMRREGRENGLLSDAPDEHLQNPRKPAPARPGIAARHQYDSGGSDPNVENGYD